MGNAAEIDIVRLKGAIDAIFDRLLASGTTSVPLDHDYYHYIAVSSVYDMTRDPSDFTVGQLSDDLEFILSVTTPDEAATALMFLHAAPLLRYVADRTTF